jgi:SAM-dependent methyltransferase
MSYKIAKDFWRKREQYPDYKDTKHRRILDVNFVTGHSKDPSSVLDLGCADGYLLIALRGCTNIKRFYGYDISENLLNELRLKWGTAEDLETKVCDFTKYINYPQVDLTLSMGLLPYIFEDDDLCSILENIKSDALIVRAPCTVKGQDEYINTYSDDLDSKYSAIYRTSQNYLTILKLFYTNVYFERSYPDKIESNYGTKHFFFVCERS